jgi:predicted flap endonuclease-1-like 5' DNA nuclease
VLYTLAKFFIWAICAGVIGLIVGWLLRGVRCDREVEYACARAVAHAPVVSHAAAPAAVGRGVTLLAYDPPDTSNTRAIFGKAISLDDLKVVEGIGPKIESVLREAGLGTWADLADADEDEIRTILRAEDERLRIHDPRTWSRQARLAALGEFEALKAWQDVLGGGRA